MRLLFVSQDFPPAVGGIQTYSWELARRWARPLSVDAVVPSHPNAARVDAAARFRIHRVPGRPDLLPITGAPTVLRQARQRRPEVAFHAQWQTTGLSLVARALTGFPRRIVCAAHGRELLFNPAASVPGLGPAYDALRRALLQRIDAFVPVSRYTGGLLEELGAPPARIHVVPNGVDADRFQPVDDASVRERLGIGEAPMLLTVGRLVRRKGLDTVLRALPTLRETHPDAVYVIVGTGPDRERLERLASDLDVRDHVRFVGRVAHEALTDFYSDASVFVMPSREDRPDVEGFGLVFLEANACRTPVVGARTGGVPDAIRHEETGLLVPPSSPDALASTLGRLLDDREWAETLGRQGRERAETRLSWDAIADRILRLLHDVLS